LPVAATKPGFWHCTAPNYAQASQMNGYTYVYVLQSETNPDRHYTGLTDNFTGRLRKHNAGEVPATALYRPWHIRTAIAFQDRTRAAAFERYLKSHSGRVFASRHF
jgi:predicted GIY-YIG superfamily endonuclease